MQLVNQNETRSIFEAGKPYAGELIMHMEIDTRLRVMEAPRLLSFFNKNVYKLQAESVVTIYKTILK
jgi:hypothetical protein